jgi:hypothetical protein
MKIKLLKSTAGMGYGYLAGQTTEIGSELGTLWVKDGVAELVSNDKNGLENNVPSVEQYLSWKKANTKKEE